MSGSSAPTSPMAIMASVLVPIATIGYIAVAVRFRSGWMWLTAAIFIWIAVTIICVRARSPLHSDVDPGPDS